MAIAISLLSNNAGDDTIIKDRIAHNRKTQHISIQYSILYQFINTVQTLLSSVWWLIHWKRKCQNRTEQNITKHNNTVQNRITVKSVAIATSTKKRTT